MTAPVVMVQGTASSVGKSAIAAGLCRLLRRRGLRVAPFKAQNMSLNAAVTHDGGEIARSVAVQAAAAGTEPTVDMNPILLKPEADLRSQVVVRGRVWGTLAARDYFAGRHDFWPVVAASLDRLRAEYGVVVAEGAGSPAELNLRDRDLVNMRVARHAAAAVLLVGDIDRGGVFAQLLGTLALLPPAERRLVRGLIVNRFRGDPALFVDGVRILEERARRPVFGVVPLVPDLGLAEEDGAVLDDAPRPSVRAVSDLRIAVVRLPRIANFDDFGPLERSPGVVVDYVDRPGDLAAADLIVLPGSKATIPDLQVLRQRGVADAILAAHARGTPVLGVCGGYQMLGREVRDPHRLESSTPAAPGLGLLPQTTTLVLEKRTCRVRARLVAGTGPFATARGAEFDAYEIHAGRTTDAAPGSAPLRLIARGGAPIDEPDGALAANGLLVGTYLHGLFDDAVVRHALLVWLRARRGLPPAPSVAPTPDPQDRWANVLETALDMPLLLARCGITVPTAADTARADGRS